MREAQRRDVGDQLGLLLVLRAVRIDECRTRGRSTDRSHRLLLDRVRSLVVVLLLTAALEVRRGREEHRAGDEGGDAAEDEQRPRDEDEDGPGCAEAVVEPALEDVAELDGEEGKGAVREDNAPPGDAELGELLHAAEDGEEGEEDPGDAHAPEDVGGAETDGENHLACEGDLREVVAHCIRYELGEVGAVDQEGETALSEGREDVEGGESDETLGCAVQKETHEETKGDHGREGEPDDAHGHRKRRGDQSEPGELGVEGGGNETTASGRGDHGDTGDDPDGHDLSEILCFLAEDEEDDTKGGEPGDECVEPPETVHGEQEAVPRARMPVAYDVLTRASAYTFGVSGRGKDLPLPRR